MQSHTRWESKVTVNVSVLINTPKVCNYAPAESRKCVSVSWYTEYAITHPLRVESDRKCISWSIHWTMQLRTSWESEMGVNVSDLVNTQRDEPRTSWNWKLGINVSDLVNTLSICKYWYTKYAITHQLTVKSGRQCVELGWYTQICSYTRPKSWKWA